MSDTPGTHQEDPVIPDPSSASGMPRWVKVFGIIGIVLVILVGIALATGHGPGRHGPSLHDPADEPSVTEQHTPPVGGHEPPEGGHG